MSNKQSLSTRRALALQHVVRGRVIVAQQRRLISDIRARNGNAADAEDLLVSFERSLVIFEDDLADLDLQEKSQVP